MHPQFGTELIAELDHFTELKTGVDMHQGKRNLSWIKRLLGETEHDRRVFADGIEHGRSRRFGHDLSHDMDALRFQNIKLRYVFHCHDELAGICLSYSEDSQVYIQ